MIFVDGVDIGDPADVALRDRRMLSADGIFIVVATISESEGAPVADTEVIFRGVPFVEQAEQLRQEIRDEVERSLARATRQTGSTRSTCSRRSCTTTSRRSSTTGCGAGRWFCRSSSKSEPRLARPSGQAARRPSIRRRVGRRKHDLEPGSLELG